MPAAEEYDVYDQPDRFTTGRPLGTVSATTNAWAFIKAQRKWPAVFATSLKVVKAGRRLPRLLAEEPTQMNLFPDDPEEPDHA
jgi:hypothetical protein